MKEKKSGDVVVRGDYNVFVTVHEAPDVSRLSGVWLFPFGQAATRC